MSQIRKSQTRDFPIDPILTVDRSSDSQVAKERRYRSRCRGYRLRVHIVGYFPFSTTPFSCTYDEVGTAALTWLREEKVATAGFPGLHWGKIVHCLFIYIVSVEKLV